MVEIVENVKQTVGRIHTGGVPGTGLWRTPA